MTIIDIIRAWKDPEYRRNLSESERATLPAHPAGIVELTDAELDTAGGLRAPRPPTSPKPKTASTTLCVQCFKTKKENTICITCGMPNC
jgi:mersacidin/lichenicidin family type 2 lantibiotic